MSGQISSVQITETSALQGIQIYHPSVNLVAGTVRLYGIKNS
jgi:hypothetical protein